MNDLSLDAHGEDSGINLMICSPFILISFLIAGKFLVKWREQVNVVPHALPTAPAPVTFQYNISVSREPITDVKTGQPSHNP